MNSSFRATNDSNSGGYWRPRSHNEIGGWTAVTRNGRREKSGGGDENNEWREQPERGRAERGGRQEGRERGEYGNSSFNRNDQERRGRGENKRRGEKSDSSELSSRMRNVNLQEQQQLPRVQQLSNIQQQQKHQNQRQHGQNYSQNEKQEQRNDSMRERGRRGERGGQKYGGARGGMDQSRQEPISNGGRGGVNHGASSSSFAQQQKENMAPNKVISSADPDANRYETLKQPAPALREGKGIKNFITNNYQIMFEDRSVYQYECPVSIEVVGDSTAADATRRISLNKGRTDPTSVNPHSELIRQALKKGLEYYRILSESGAIVHDGGAVVFANEELDGVMKQHDGELVVPIEALDAETRKLIRNANARNVVIEVRFAKKFDMKDISEQLTKNCKMDSTVKQFFEVLTSADAVNSGRYTFHSNGRLFDNSGGFNDIGNGQMRLAGMNKGAGVVEGDGRSDGITAALIIDSSTGTFWKSQMLWRTICELNGWYNEAHEVSPERAKWTADVLKKTEIFIKNIRVVYTTGQTKFDFLLKGMSITEDGSTFMKLENVQNTNEDGTKESAAAEFGEQLKLKDWPCVYAVTSRRVSDGAPGNYKRETTRRYLPIEVLKVLPGQRVPLYKQVEEPETAEDPGKRLNKIKELMARLNLDSTRTTQYGTNAVMKAFGVSVSPAPLRVEGIIRAVPEINFKRGLAEVDHKTTGMRTMKHTFFIPSDEFVLVVAGSQESYRQAVVSASKSLRDKCRAKGMIVNELLCMIVPSHMKEMSATFKKLKEDQTAKKKRHLFFYIEEERSHGHGLLKLMERKFEVVTQHLKLEVYREQAKDQKKLMTLMENLVLKINMKTGGHNYVVAPEKFAHELWMGHGRRTMVLAYDVWHPSDQSAVTTMQERIRDVKKPVEMPSVVGFSFNGGVRPDTFIGDFHYQNPRQEHVEAGVLQKRMEWMLKIFELNRKTLPDLIIVVRDGISDGQFTHAIDELAALREAAEEYAQSPYRTKATNKMPIENYKPKFIFSVATKRHHRRIFDDNGGQPSGAGGGGGGYRRTQQPKVCNALPMTAVDTVITTGGLFEFYLNSAHAKQGTSKFTRYVVLKSDVAIGQDEMQSFMSALCFNHQISSHSIGIPAPVFQADEWAKRGSALLREFKKHYNLMDWEVMSERLGYWDTELESLRANA